MRIKMKSFLILATICFTIFILYEIKSLENNKTVQVSSEIQYVVSDTDSFDDVNVSSVRISAKKAKMKIGRSKKLYAFVFPGNADKKKVVWKTDNKKVATVTQSGKVTAKSCGKATITATADGKTDTFVALVKPPKPGRLRVSLLKRRSRTVVIEYKKPLNVTGIQIQYIRRGNLDAKQFKVKTGSFKKTFKQKGVYKFRIRSYKRVDGQILYSSFTMWRRVHIK